VKPHTDALLSKVSSSWKARTQRKKEEFQREVEMNISDPQLLMITKFEEFREEARAAFMFIISILFIILSVVSLPVLPVEMILAVTIASGIALLTASIFNSRASRLIKIIKPVEQQKRQRS
jgi:hypothetical protein